MAFIGNSVYSYDEDTFVRNSPSKLYINRFFGVFDTCSITEKDPQSNFF